MKDVQNREHTAPAKSLVAIGELQCDYVSSKNDRLNKKNLFRLLWCLIIDQIFVMLAMKNDRTINKSKPEVIECKIYLISETCDWRQDLVISFWPIFFIWAKVFNNGPNKICGTQSFKNLKCDGLLRQIISHITSKFLEAVFQKCYLVHSLIHWPICPFQAYIPFYFNASQYHTTIASNKGNY